jgi:hypothetical protein
VAEDLEENRQQHKTAKHLAVASAVKTAASEGLLAWIGQSENDCWKAQNGQWQGQNDRKNYSDVLQKWNQKLEFGRASEIGEETA